MAVIPSEVERSPEIYSPKTIHRFPDSAQNDKAQQATRPLFQDLTVYHDQRAHPAAMNMSIDEALLEWASIPTIRFYRWRSPALSFGYFGKFSDVAIYATDRDLVRRWTGGGIVFHGDDLTYAIVIPASDPAFEESSIAIYEKIHRALADALNGVGEHAVVAGDVDLDGIAFWKHAAIRASGYNCFANPVRADVMMDGRKIAGAAQRRTRRGLLQQGSIQGFALKTDLAQKFSQALSANCREYEVNEEIFQRGRELANQKYGTEFWLKKR
jgi:lipoyl(octanoyl) transferase